jgi:replication-associated recombination protein RarA
MTPDDFIYHGPQEPEDLIGKGRTIARLFIDKVKSGVVSPIKILCYGPPGIGKSATCRIIARALVRHSSEVRRMSAKTISVDHIKDWMQDCYYVSDQWRVYLIEEVDEVNSDVETLLLHFMDELPDRSAILVTSNEKMSGIEDRFQSRCRTFKFERHPAKEVEKFLLSRWPELGEAAREIAESTNGDVRASLNDAALELDSRKYGKK